MVDLPERDGDGYLDGYGNLDRGNWQGHGRG